MNKLTDLTTSEMKKFAGGFGVGVIVAHPINQGGLSI